MMKLVYLAGFGVLGVLARYFMGVAVTRLFPSPFPYATFAINLLGSFVLGVVYVAGVERALISPELRIGISVGLLGGFTTFSSYSLESAYLLETAQYGYAFLYFGLSPLLGLTATFGGLRLARLFIA